MGQFSTAVLIQTGGGEYGVPPHVSGSEVRGQSGEEAVETGVTLEGGTYWSCVCVWGGGGQGVRVVVCERLGRGE